jgi:UDP-glucose 4-epimerase
MKNKPEYKKTILITGVAGLIGSRLADWITEHHPEYSVIGVDNLSGGYEENVNAKVHLLPISCQSPSLDLYFDMFKPEYVFHFAAYAAEGLSPFIRCFNYENNLVATANVVNACIKHGVKRLVFASSMAVYGKGFPPFSEIDQPSPIDPYGVAKYACEQDIKIAGEQHGLDWCIIRPHNVYGIKQNIWDRYRNVLGIWMYQHLNNKPMTIYGDGSQVRAFSYIDDCLLPIWKAATDQRTSKEIINLGGTQEYSILEANNILKNVIGGGETIFLEPRHEVEYAFPTYQKSIDLLDYSDNTSLHNGLSAMWEWAKKQPDRKQFVWDNYEITNGIYSYWK